MITAILATRDNEIELAFALSPLVPAAIEGVLREVIIVDGGSRDGTLAVAHGAGCRIIEGSDSQALIEAAADAKAEWLLFLSPLSVLDPGWHGEAMSFIDRAILSGNGREAAAVFRLSRAEPGFKARLAELTGVFRSRFVAAPYEEQGLLISRSLYRAVGGHRPLPAMADVDLARRIGRRRLTLLRSRATVNRSSVGSGGFGRSLRNGACLAMFLLRLPPTLIGRLAA